MLIGYGTGEIVWMTLYEKKGMLLTFYSGMALEIFGIFFLTFLKILRRLWLSGSGQVKREVELDAV